MSVATSPAKVQQPAALAHRKRANARKWGEGLLRGIVILAALIFCLFPVYWAAVTSLKNPVDVGAIPPKWLFTPVLDHYKTMLVDWNMLVFLKSSLILASSSTVMAVMVGTLAAYALSRFRMRGKQAIAMDILSIRMVPPIVTAVPIFLLARRWGLYNSYALVIPLYVLFNLPLIIWVMKSFLDEIPKELDEAAMVDGAGTMQTFLRVILPVATPGLACVTILTFIFTWNEFLIANVLLAGDNRTLPVVSAFGLLARAILWGPAAATTVTIIIPVIILTLFVQRWIVRGLSFGAVKG
jgi:multiple sugar transport system permease protein